MRNARKNNRPWKAIVMRYRRARAEAVQRGAPMTLQQRLQIVPSIMVRERTLLLHRLAQIHVGGRKAE